MDPLHICIALGPLAMYLLLLGAINLSRRPFITTGGRDAATLGVSLAGFIAAGPMELFMPESAANRFGSYVWLMMLALYSLSIALVVLLMRPRIVIYNTSFEQLRPALADAVGRLDPEARWAGDNLTMPTLGVQLHIEPWVAMKNVQLVSSGPDQSHQGWRRLERELAAELHSTRGAPGVCGVSLLASGIMLAGMITYWLYSEPQQVADGIANLLRR